MKELRRMEGGVGCGGEGAIWSLDGLYDEYGTMRAGSGTILGIANATRRLHVKGMPLTKRKRLANIMGVLFEDEEEGDKSPDAKILRVTSPKVVVPAGEVSGDKGGAEAEVSKDAADSDDNRRAGTAHTVGSGDTLAAATSEEWPP